MNSWSAEEQLIAGRSGAKRINPVEEQIYKKEKEEDNP